MRIIAFSIAHSDSDQSIKSYYSIPVHTQDGSNAKADRKSQKRVCLLLTILQEKQKAVLSFWEIFKSWAREMADKCMTNFKSCIWFIVFSQYTIRNYTCAFQCWIISIPLKMASNAMWTALWMWFCDFKQVWLHLAMNVQHSTAYFYFKLKSLKNIAHQAYHKHFN